MCTLRFNPLICEYIKFFRFDRFGSNFGRYDINIILAFDFSTGFLGSPPVAEIILSIYEFTAFVRAYALDGVGSFFQA